MKKLVTPSKLLFFSFYLSIMIFIGGLAYFLFDFMPIVSKRFSNRGEVIYIPGKCSINFSDSLKNTFDAEKIVRIRLNIKSKGKRSHSILLKMKELTNGQYKSCLDSGAEVTSYDLFARSNKTFASYFVK